MEGGVLVYDDDCGFCTWCAAAVEERAGVEIVGFSALSPALRARLPAEYESCSHLLTHDRVYSCGASIEEGLLRTPTGSHARPLVSRLRKVGPYVAAREWAYRRVARNRGLLGRLRSKSSDE